MKKLIIMVLLAAFSVGCTATSVEEDDYEYAEYGTDKDKSVTRTGDGSEYEADNSED